MGSILEIRTTPISIEYKINKARYEIVNTNASIETTNNNSGHNMHMKHIELDTFKGKYSTEIKNDIKMVGDLKKGSIRTTYDATDSYEGKGNMLNVNTRDNSIGEIALKRFNSDISFNFIQMAGNDREWDSIEFKIKHEMDKFSFDWKINKPEIKFIPSNIEIIIKEYPRLEINYMGKPIYVPASADPDYVPIDTFA